jgi:VanZ family protein
MLEPRPPARLWLVTAIMAAVIVYGSLYPFDFRVPARGIGPLATFLASWDQRPGRGDFVANILLYLPFGFCFLLGFRRGPFIPVALLLAALAGALLSLSIELIQYYDAGRVTAASDFYSNTIGTLVGGLAALAIGASFRLPFIGEIPARPIPTLLLLSWLAYRLYPYVPTIDLHKYWNALKPIVLTPSLDAYDLFRQTAVWLTLYALIEAIVRNRRSAFLALLFAAAVLCARVLIIDTVLRVAELAGAGLAFVIWLGLLTLPARLRAGLAALALCAYVVALRLEPFQFQPVGRGFGWAPFLSLMRGSLVVDSLAFLEKFFLYGSMLYLLGTALARGLPATILVAVMLFATSWAQTYLPGRSAELTDTLIALTIAVIFALLPTERDTPATASRTRLTARERRLRDWQRDQARALGVKLDG